MKMYIGTINHLNNDSEIMVVKSPQSIPQVEDFINLHENVYEVKARLFNFDNKEEPKCYVVIEKFLRREHNG